MRKKSDGQMAAIGADKVGISLFGDEVEFWNSEKRMQDWLRQSRRGDIRPNLVVEFADVPLNCGEEELFGEFADGFGFVGAVVFCFRASLVFEEFF